MNKKNSNKFFLPILFILSLVLVLNVIVLLGETAICHAAKGVVVYKTTRCDYFIVEGANGYDLLEWYGGNDPDKGDMLVGDYESYGMKQIYNITDDDELTVWVEDYWLSKNDVIEKYFEHCE
jgi:hypothetical protein